MTSGSAHAGWCGAGLHVVRRVPDRSPIWKGHQIMKGRIMKRTIRGDAGFSAMLGCAAVLAALTSATAQQPTPPANRKVFANSVTPLPLQRGLAVAAASPGPEHQNDTMD